MAGQEKITFCKFCRRPINPSSVIASLYGVCQCLPIQAKLKEELGAAPSIQFPEGDNLNEKQRGIFNEILKRFVLKNREKIEKILNDEKK